MLGFAVWVPRTPHYRGFQCRECVQRREEEKIPRREMTPAEKREDRREMITYFSLLFVGLLLICGVCMGLGR